MNLSKLPETVKDRGAWYAEVHGVTQNRTRLINWTTRIQPLSQGADSTRGKDFDLESLKLGVVVEFREDTPDPTPDINICMIPRAVSIMGFTLMTKKLEYRTQLNLGEGDYPDGRDFSSVQSLCYSHAFWETNSLRKTMQRVECSLLHWWAQGRVSS